MPKIKNSEVVVHCAHDRMVRIGHLKPNPDNPNEHTKSQIRMLAFLIGTMGWRHPITVSKNSGMITKGHGRLEAAKLLGVTTVPVDFQYYKDSLTERADVIGDNRISELSDLDLTILRDVFEGLNDGKFNMLKTGFTNRELEEVMTASGRGSGKLRQIVLIYDRRAYKKIVKALDRIRERNLANDMTEAASKAILAYSKGLRE